MPKTKTKYWTYDKCQRLPATAILFFSPLLAAENRSHGGVGWEAKTTSLVSGSLDHQSLLQTWLTKCGLIMHKMIQFSSELTQLLHFMYILKFQSWQKSLTNITHLMFYTSYTSITRYFIHFKILWVFLPHF